MQFENPEVKDGINVSKEHPLKEFIQLLVGVFVFIAVVMIALNYSVTYFAKKVPFSYEEKLVQHIDALDVVVSDKQQYLQSLADRISKYMELPEGMTIKVHFKEGETVNAFATVGGNVFFFQGLINRLPSENALAMVMAHEIAHIKHRHPIAAMGKGVTMMALTSSISGAAGSDVGKNLMNESMVLGLLKFSRDQETQSDISALGALNELYGHVQGAKELFDVFNQLSGVSNKKTELFLSHPHSENRWDKLKLLSNQYGWQMSGDVTPLPAIFNQ